MTQGSVVEIYIGPEFEQPMHPVQSVEALAGQGLAGDRYFRSEDVVDEHDPTEEVTLIASEAIEAARRNHGVDFGAQDTRRNIVTRGVALDELLGQRFLVGDVELEGLEPNPPCSHLERITGKKLLKPLIDGGGIRARIVRSGSIRVGDIVRSA